MRKVKCLLKCLQEGMFSRRIYINVGKPEEISFQMKNQHKAITDYMRPKVLDKTLS